MTQVKKIGVIGCGIMGQGIAQVAALAGYEVYINDISLERIEAAIKSVTKALTKTVDLNRSPSQEMLAVYWKGANAVARLHPAVTIADFSDCDIVIEAATENKTIKLGVLDQVTLKTGAILATNTSSISITELSEIADFPDRFIGIHFFNPVPVMKLVEVISGSHTSDETVQMAKAFVESLGKTPVEAKDSAGFIVNRTLIPFINEAIQVLYEGVGTVQGIDTALKLGAGHPMGALALADLIGNDTNLAIMRVLEAELGDKYKPSPLLEQMVEKGLLGKKTGKGFWDYSTQPPTPNM